jgi:hypothetical protein
MNVAVAVLFAGAAALASSEAPSRPPVSSLYARVESRLSREPALAEALRAAPGA